MKNMLNPIPQKNTRPKYCILELYWSKCVNMFFLAIFENESKYVGRFICKCILKKLLKIGQIVGHHIEFLDQI